MLPEGAEVVLDQLQVQGRDRILMVLRPAGADGSCPVCQRRSDRIHSWYHRRLHDLPWEGIPVRIELQVRRFFCDSNTTACKYLIVLLISVSITCRSAVRSCLPQPFKSTTYEGIPVSPISRGCARVADGCRSGKISSVGLWSNCPYSLFRNRGVSF